MNPDELRKLLNRRLGPMPVWAWLAVAAVGVAAAAAIARRRRGGAAAVESPEPADADQPASDGAVTRPTPFTLGGFTVPGSGVTATGSGVTPDPYEQPDVPEPRTNDDWSADAIRYGIGRGFEPNVVQSAVAKFLASEGLSPQEYQIVNIIQGKVGTPPQPVAPATLVQSPTGGSTGGGTPPPATVTPPVFPPAWLAGVRFVKADQGSTATYEVTSEGLRWIRDIPELTRLGGGTAEQAVAQVRIFPVSLMRGLPRIGPKPPAGTDASL